MEVKKQKMEMKMNKIALLGLIVGFGLNGFSAECKLLMKPFDFQLDKQLVAPNESKVFSKSQNRWEQASIFGYAGTLFCGLNIGDVRNNTDKIRACSNELDELSKEHTAKFDKIIHDNNRNVVDIDHAESIFYGFKTSKYAPISEKQLCNLQKKYGYKEENIPVANSYMTMRQNATYKHYLKVAEKVGMSEDRDTISPVHLNTNYSSDL